MTRLILVFALAGLAAGQSLDGLEEQAFQQAAALAEPSVVRIETVGGIDVVGQVLTGTGPTTGVVVTPDGYVITSSFNFASKPASIIVTLPDDRRLPADVVATDELRMLTLLKVELPNESTRLSPLAAAPRKDFRVGQWSIALGRTYDNSFPNVSVGIISAINRVWGRAVQTDAKISPANYGGPLIDVQGRGIGILVPLSPEKTDETAGVEWYDGGIGFAIPLEDVYTALDRMKTGETLKPGLMGVSFKDQGLLAGEAKIDRVRPESPAEVAGLKVGDVIVEADGEPIDRVPQLKHVLGRKYAGDRLAVAVKRGSETVKGDLLLVAELKSYESGYLGILPARTEIGATLAGVEVREVLPGSPAKKAGLERRDVIVKFGAEAVATPAALLDLVSRKHPGDRVEVTIRRADAERTIAVELASLPNDVPESLPAATIPAPKEPVAGEGSPKSGRITGTLGEDEERRYWAYVPGQYNPAYRYGLLVWLHPSGDTMEAAALKLWQQHCDRRGIILVAPKSADLNGWTARELEFVHDLIEEFTKKYSIDPARICVHGQSDGGELAWRAAFKHRELVRAVCPVSAPLKAPPPDNEPAYRLQIAIVAGDDDPAKPQIDKSVELLREMKYPVTRLEPETLDGRYLDEAGVDTLARWLDLLDRI